MRFTIRDLLWLTVVVALGVAWWVDRNRLATWINKLEKQRIFIYEVPEKLSISLEDR